MHHRLDNQNGVALVLALYLTAALSVIATGLMFLSQVETYSSANYRTMSQARYGAEAGVNKAVYFLLNGYTSPTTTNPTDPFAAYDISRSPVQLGGKAVVLSTVKGVSSNYADPTVVAAFLAATAGSMNLYPGTVAYAAAATMVAMRQVNGQTVITWQITGDGTVPGARPATVQVMATLEKQVVRAAGNSYAAFATSGACGALSLSSSKIDSYDSAGRDSDDDRWDHDDRDHDGWRDHDRDHDGWRDDDHDHDGWNDNDHDRDGWDDDDDDRDGWNDHEDRHRDWDFGHHAARRDDDRGGQVVNATFNPVADSPFLLLVGGMPRGHAYGWHRHRDNDPEPTDRRQKTTTSGGDVGTNGNLTATYGSTVNGSLSTPRTGVGTCSGSGVNAQTTSGGSRVTGSIVRLSQTVTATTPAMTGPTPGTSTYSLSGGTAELTNAAGPQALGNVHLTYNATLVLQAGVYNFNSLTLASSSQIVIESGPVTINILGNGDSSPIQMSGAVIGGADDDDNTWDATQLTINYAGNGALQIANDSIVIGQLNAPNAHVSINDSDVYGSVIGSTIALANASRIHFDRRLKSTALSTYTVGADMLTSFSWKKY